MQRDLHNFFDGRNKVLIVGDLNTRCTTWKNHINNANGNTIYEYYINIHRTQQPTHYPPYGSTPTYIDIVLNKNVNEFTDLTTKLALSSDHNPIKFEIRANRTDERQDITTRKTFKHTNWAEFRNYFDRMIVINDTTQQLEQEVEKLTKIIPKVIDKHTQN